MTTIETLHETCHCYGMERQNAILYTILSQTNNHNHCSSLLHHSCPCEGRRTVCLKTPQLTCQAASDVLVKTVSFMKNLPSFHNLPKKDQFLLLESCWTPLFILGLAQDMVFFEVVETPVPSMLKRILLNGQCKSQVEESDRTQPTLSGVQRLQSCLNKFWSMDLSPKEYAYLKGAILFNPDIPGLRASLYVESLQQEAQRALREVLLPLHPEDIGRFARILLTASTLKTISPALITELFFRPIMGSTDIIDLLNEMLHTK
ncbi:nuclear receptor subfamily 0 group B member 2 [Protopterus annectens]|uniref:nuclear receptor subfamily 0 group B member 2 n=1 Tax=Protopterus annectens TaxID=7888 RepID=UPI001CFAE764|nr:nuclear receptor subfamily 0 group B member 2 [Protopterus annectens]